MVGALLRVMGADVKGIDRGRVPGQFRLNVPVQTVDIRFIEIAAGDTRLVGDDDDQEAGVLQAFDGLRRTGQKREILDPVKVVFFDIDRAVAVEEYRPPGGIPRREA